MSKNSNKKTKAVKTLENYKANVGQWLCSTCASGSSQPARIIQNLRNDGYVFEETSTGRYAKSLVCEKCGEKHTHYKLLSVEPSADKKSRCVISPAQRKRVIALLGGRDAFTGAKITSKPEIDHKTPFARLKQDIDISSLTDEEVKEHFQLLTREHNLLKDRKCQQCIKNGKRPSFLCSNYWYVGNENYTGSCVGCGWHDGVKWHEEHNKEGIRENARNNLIQYLYKELDNIDIE